MTTPYLIFIADCDDVAEATLALLRAEGMTPLWRRFGKVEALVDALGEVDRGQVILCDHDSRYFDSEDVLGAVREAATPVPVIVLVRRAHLPDAVALMRAGAHDIIEKKDGLRLAETIRQVQQEAVPDTDLDDLALAVFNSAREAIMVSDADNRILVVNDGFTATTGYSQEDVIGKSPNILKSGKQDAIFYRQMWSSVAEQGHWEGEIWNRRKNGEVYPEWLSISVMRDRRGRIVRHIAIFSDITDRKRNEDRLHYRAHHDPLTGLPNRTLGLDRLTLAMAAARRGRAMVAVMFVDLDRFKPVNDELGHEAGDIVLREVATRLLSCVRETDTVCRFGGDEFLVIVTNASTESAAVTVADHILEAVARPYSIYGRKVEISASVGIALYPLHGEDPADLVRQSDSAMYIAKREGRNRFALLPRAATDAA
jgi:diguanylate cyclase (GGDEF)-like protein/PAS domain S-box-containing protein